MSPRINKWVNKINALSVRERALLMLAMVAILVGLWEVALMSPLNAQRTTLQQHAARLQKTVNTTHKTITVLAQKLAQDPNAALRQQLAADKKAIARLDTKFESLTAGLVMPRQMASALEKILRSQHGLHLISIANTPAQPLVVGDDKAQSAHVFSHGLTLKFTGSFLNTLRYVRTLADLPLHFYWDSLDINMQHYPTNKVTLKVHTISFAKGWLGV